MRRWPWQDELGETSAGWILAGVTAVIVAIGLLIQWLNDMHMYGYGVFGR